MFGPFENFSFSDISPACLMIGLPFLDLQTNVPLQLCVSQHRNGLKSTFYGGETHYVAIVNAL